jgi:anthranilate synthase component 1
VSRLVGSEMCIRDRSRTGESHFVCETAAESEFKLQQLRSDLQFIRTHSSVDYSIELNAFEEEDPLKFLSVVKQTQSHIAAGDIYQANLSRGWQAHGARVSPTGLYQRLKAANPSPYAGLVRLEPDHYVISSSPERLIEVRDGWVSTRPIAGTRPRHTDAQIDQSLMAELHAHPKERAEHIMLLDLERNDLGRICMAGTVHVNEYMSIESYRHVHHIVSNVKGQQRPEVTPGQTIAAVFPGGTITGCPKVRCMEIIASLEPNARGAYTGSMGYLNRDGSMDLNILIRSIEMRGGRVRFRAGAGIVSDSIPERELEETRAKALGLLRVLKD